MQIFQLINHEVEFYISEDFSLIIFQVTPELEKFMDAVQTRVNSIYDMIDFLKAPDIPQKKTCYTVQLDMLQICSVFSHIAVYF